MANPKYAVFKRSDVETLLDPMQRAVLRQLETEIAERRKQQGKSPLDCIVVASDQSGYTLIKQAIEGRMDVDHEDVPR